MPSDDGKCCIFRHARLNHWTSCICFYIPCDSVVSAWRFWLSVFFLYTEEGKRKRGTSIWCLLYCVPEFIFIREVWCSVVCLPGLLYYMMPGIPWQMCHPLSNQPHGFMYHHYLLMFDMFHTPGVCNFLLAYLTFLMFGFNFMQIAKKLILVRNS